MNQEWLAFLSAVQFLTRLPIPDPGWEEGRLDRGAKWFPLVGLIVGLLSGLALLLSLHVWNDPRISVAVTLIAGVFITGALHEDGLADTADGLGGGTDISHRLRIMKDSNIGTYGSLALMLAMLLRFVVLVSLCGQISVAVFAVVAAQAVSRAAMLPIIWSLTYARSSDDAKVVPLTASPTIVGVAAAGLIVLAACAPLITQGWAVSTGLISTAVACLAMRRLMTQKLGGWTGDTAGATQLVSEIAFLLGVAAWI